MKVKVLDKKTKITNAYNNITHKGVDLGFSSNPMNVLAHAAGEVIMAVKGKGNNKGATGTESYGNLIKIKHQDYYTLYAHLEEVNVNVGEQVNAGQKIAVMGDSGNAYGVHLHFEVRNASDIRMDPTQYLTENMNHNSKKNNEEIVVEVISGKWGNGQERKDRLTKEGYNYTTIQNMVNGKSNDNKTDIETIVTEVIQGKWGNGQERKDRFTRAGYNYNEIQTRVNRKM